MEDMNEVNDALGRNYGVSDDIDEADLDAELAGLEDELEGMGEEEGEQSGGEDGREGGREGRDVYEIVYQLSAAEITFLFFSHPSSSSSLLTLTADAAGATAESTPSYLLPSEPLNMPEARLGAKTTTDEFGLPVAPLHN